jgi:hypothetical protein
MRLKGTTSVIRISLANYQLSAEKGIKTFALAAAMLMFPFFSMGQACCSGGVPLGGSLGLGTAERNALQVLITYDYNKLGDLFDGSEYLNDQNRQRVTQSALLEINYGISERLGIAGVLPFIRQERKISSFGGQNDFSKAQGIGDALILIKYRLLVSDLQSKWEWVAGAGPKLPTGRTNHTANNGIILAADMQPGSGSLDGILWSYLQRNRFLSNNISVAGVTMYRYSGNHKRYNQSQTYSFGNEFQASLGLNYSLYAKWPVTVFNFLRYRSQTPDLIDGAEFPGSGGKWIYAIPGLNIDFSKNYSFRLSGDIPLYRKLNGTQLTTSWKMTAALLFNISGS